MKGLNFDFEGEKFQKPEKKRGKLNPDWCFFRYYYKSINVL
jgi:hypothetical protein